MSIVGVLQSDTIDLGQVKNYDLAIPRGAKYVVELGGPATVRFGLYQGFVSGSTGKLKVCGAGAWGCRTLDAAPHLIQCTGLGEGPFTFLVRPWSFFDYWAFWMNKHPSTCT